MKDIDFDELDRAVSSVLGQNATTATDEDAASQEAVPVTAPAVEMPTETVSEEPVGDTLVESAPAAPSATPLAIKRRGKFMDVMHPSADMQPSSAPAVKSPRTAPVVQPLSTTLSDESSEATSEPTAALDESHALIGAEPAPVDTSLLSVEATDSDDTSTDYQTDDTQAADTNESEPSDTLSVPEENTQPLAIEAHSESESSEESTDNPGEAELGESAEVSSEGAPAGGTPFLTDTQVEKRPLGAFGTAEAEAADAPQAEGGGSVNEELPAEPAPAAAPAAPLPRELQPDVVGVESIQEAEARENAESGGSAPAATNPFATNVAAAPEASDGRVEGHPLFDTSTYHEPVAAVSHGAIPGWAKWLIGLLICLAVGAGVGYFLFTAGL